MSIKLSDTQLVILSAAAQRDDRSLTPPVKLKGGAADKVAVKLITAGLVKEVKARAGMPVWRRDEQNAQSYSLKLTAAGVNAIAVTPDDDATPAVTEERSRTEQSPTLAPPAQTLLECSPRRAPKRSRCLERRGPGPSWRRRSRCFEQPKARR
jgi:hypothetical protein